MKQFVSFMNGLRLQPAHSSLKKTIQICNFYHVLFLFILFSGRIFPNSGIVALLFLLFESVRFIVASLRLV